MKAETRSIAIDELNCVLKSLEENQNQNPLSMFPGKLSGPGCQMKQTTISDILGGDSQWRQIDLKKNSLIEEKYGLGFAQLLSQIKIAIGALVLILLVNSYWFLTQNWGQCDASADVQCSTQIMAGSYQMDYKRPSSWTSSYISYYIWFFVGYVFRVQNVFLRRKTHAFMQEKFKNERQDILLKEFEPGLTKVEIEQIIHERMRVYLKKKKIVVSDEAVPLIELARSVQVYNHQTQGALVRKLNDIYTKIVLLLHKKKYKQELVHSTHSHLYDSTDLSFTIKACILQSAMINSEEPQEEEQEQVAKYSNEVLERILKGSKEKKLLKLLVKYNKAKERFRANRAKSQDGSSIYLIQCRTFDEEQLVYHSLRYRRNIFSRMWNAVKYFFQVKGVWLNQAASKQILVMDVNWKAIGVSYTEKHKKRIFIRAIGTLQFLISSGILIVLGMMDFVFEGELKTTTGIETVFGYFWKTVFTLFQTVIFLVNEKLYSSYSKKMAFSTRSSEIDAYLKDFFLFYAISYVYGPMLGFLTQSEVIDITPQNGKNPFSDLGFSPFSIYLQNVMIAMLIFGFKACVSIDMMKKYVQQVWYQKKQRWKKLTQHQINKIFSRSKFVFKDTSMLVYSMIILSIPITYAMPQLLLLPISILLIEFFVLKFEYFSFLRPKYFSPLVHNQTSSKLSGYIKFLNFVTLFTFCDNTDQVMASFYVGIISWLVEILWILCKQIKNPIEKRQKLKSQKITEILQRITQPDTECHENAVNENKTTGRITVISAYSAYCEDLNHKIRQHL